MLKQQLRDLVLRRKSLVREEPEDETLVENFTQRYQTLAQNQNNQLKTGMQKQHSNIANSFLGLAYDAAMSKHQCLCGENQNHVEHGGRVHSIWARLQERGLVDTCERVTIRKASLELLRLVHSPTYVTFFAVSPTACLKLDPSILPLKSFVQLPCGGIGVDSDTYFNDANTQLATRIAVGSLVELASQVVNMWNFCWFMQNFRLLRGNCATVLLVYVHLDTMQRRSRRWASVSSIMFLLRQNICNNDTATSVKRLPLLIGMYTMVMERSFVSK